MSEPLTAVVTFGGTSEPLDDVRVLTNRSTGRFGAAIVRALASAGVEVTALGSPTALAALARGGPLPATCRAQAFETTADLAAALEALEAAPPRLLFMAAAVSDYRPPRREGKLRSTQERLVLELERTPKLLARLRDALGPDALLVGFKLLSGVSREELIEVAARQARDNRLDLTVANDLARLTSREHPVVLVDPEGGAQPLEGARELVAQRLVAAALARVGAPSALPAPTARAAPPGAEALLALGAAPAAWRAEGASWLRAPDSDWESASVDLDAWRARTAAGPTPEGALLSWLAAVSGAAGVARLPAGLGVADAQAPDPAPAGSRGAGQRALDALLDAARAGLDPSRGWLLETPQGLLLGVPRDAQLAAAWTRAEAGLRAWLDGHGLTPPACAPLWWGPRVVGAAARGPDWVEPWVLPELRGRGFGDRLADALTRGGQRVALPAAEDPGFFVRRGFRPGGEEGGRRLWDPPSLETPARVGASVCIVDVPRRRVLVGRRLREPWRGRTSFPGGGVEAGETPWAAARRELEEETGLVVRGAPWFERVVYAGDAAHVLRVHCFAVGCLQAELPRETDEFAAEWVELDAAQARQLTPCARPILDAIAARL